MKTLSEYRKEKKLTQKELANKTGIAVSTIAMYETGEREPSLKRARILANFFGVSIADIFFGKQTHGERAKKYEGKSA